MRSLTQRRLALSLLLWLLSALALTHLTLEVLNGEGVRRLTLVIGAPLTALLGAFPLLCSQGGGSQGNGSQEGAQSEVWRWGARVALMVSAGLLIGVLWRERVTLAHLGAELKSELSAPSVSAHHPSNEPSHAHLNAHEAPYGKGCDPAHPAPAPRALTPLELKRARARWGQLKPREARHTDRRPDIIFISADAVRADALSLPNASGELPPTPHVTPQLLARASEGAVFTQAQSPASSTRQSFRALFTGVYPSLSEAPKTRRWALSMGPQQVTLAERLKATGYRTYALISARGTFTAHKSAMRGFERLDLTPAKTWSRLKHAAPTHVNRVISHLSDPLRPPTFIWTHLLDTHQRYSPGPNHPQRPRFKGARRRYQQALHSVDASLGRLLDFALSPTRRHRTLVIFTSDHGQLFGEAGLGRDVHGLSTLSAETHVPLMVWGAGVKPGRYTTPVSLLDLYPTLLEVAGFEGAPWSCGRSLSDALFEGRPPEPRPLLLEQLPDHSKESFGVSWLNRGERLDELPLEGRWRVSAPHQAHQAQLFDEELFDEGEGSDEARERRERLRAELKAHLQRVGVDPTPYGL